MGRLSMKGFARQVRIWVLPLGLSFLFIGGYHTIFANPEPTIDDLAAYLRDSSLSVGYETIDGYQHVFYMIDDRKVFITSGGENNKDVTASGEHMVWVKETNGGGQIILHNVLDKVTLQLSGEGTNQNPVIDDNKVVWEKWSPAGWNIFAYDGLSVRQLSQDYVSIRPQIQGSQVVYAQKLSGELDNWQVVVHNLDTDQIDTIATGNAANAWPHFKDDFIETKYDPSL